MGCGICQASLSGLISGLGFLGLFILSISLRLFATLVLWAKDLGRKQET